MATGYRPVTNLCPKKANEWQSAAMVEIKNKLRIVRGPARKYVGIKCVGCEIYLLREISSSGYLRHLVRDTFLMRIL